jgi:hypothetical protein
MDTATLRSSARNGFRTAGRGVVMTADDQEEIWYATIGQPDTRLLPAVVSLLVGRKGAAPRKEPPRKSARLRTGEGHSSNEVPCVPVGVGGRIDPPR